MFVFDKVSSTLSFASDFVPLLMLGAAEALWKLYHCQLKDVLLCAAFRLPLSRSLVQASVTPCFVLHRLETQFGHTLLWPFCYFSLRCWPV